MRNLEEGNTGLECRVGRALVGARILTAASPRGRAVSNKYHVTLGAPREQKNKAPHYFFRSYHLNLLSAGFFSVMTILFGLTRCVAPSILS